MRLPPEKVEKVQAATNTMLAKRKATLLEIQTVASFLS
jgi:hypothetical protein